METILFPSLLSLLVSMYQLIFTSILIQMNSSILIFWYAGSHRLQSLRDSRGEISLPRMAIDGSKFVRFSRERTNFNPCVATEQKLIYWSTSVEWNGWKKATRSAAAANGCSADLRILIVEVSTSCQNTIMQQGGFPPFTLVQFFFVPLADRKKVSLLWPAYNRVMLFFSGIILT